MIRIFTVLALLVSFGSSTGQVIQRNILATRYTADSVSRVLIPMNDFHPYPTTPEAWAKQVPVELMGKVIQQGADKLTLFFR